jgi:hypothetical protein
MGPVEALCTGVLIDINNFPFCMPNDFNRLTILTLETT